ncbi:MAG: hypothetical protein KGD65_09010 [Candidatus Lokiarchaeota archaeon]|nr:hypothetical protein [Candidatus Lokiarchaeota archaeon]
MSSNGSTEVDISLIPEINYNSLNDLWYNPKIEMLIISPNRSDFIDESNRLMEWKNKKGVKTIVLSNFSLYEGRDDAEKIRNMIKSYYEKENIRWVLLAGDAQEDLIPIRKVYNPDVLLYGDGQSEAIPGENYKPTDFYYADLTGSWDSDGDGEEEDGGWGESPRDNLYGLDEISWIPEVYVGRFPADTASELGDMVNKTIKYEKNPDIGDWMNRMLLAGGVSDLSPLEDEAVLTTHIWSNYALNEMEFTHLHRTASPYDPPIPPEPNSQEGLTNTNIRTEMNFGYSTVMVASHGFYTYFQDAYGSIFTDNQAKGLTNDMPFLFYGDACTTSSYDVNDDSIGEILIKQPNTGAIGSIGALRVTWYFEGDTNLEMLNRGNAKLFWKEFFVNEKFQQGKALYDSKVAYINSDYYTKGFGSTIYDFERKNLLTYNLLGDPEVDVYTNIPQQVLNPFNENLYEGQLASITIQDIHNKIIPNARVHFTSSDGKFSTVYADSNGIANFRLPAVANETYNVTITGHNLIPTYFNITALPDTTQPELIGLECIPKNPISSDTIYFNIETSDNYSGINSVFLLLSDDNFENYVYYSTSSDLFDNQNEFTINIDKVKPGEYSYCIISRDYANNSIIFHDNGFKLTIPKPITDYILPVSLILIIGFTGLSIFQIVEGIKKATRIFGYKDNPNNQPD